MMQNFVCISKDWRFQNDLTDKMHLKKLVKKKNSLLQYTGGPLCTVGWVDFWRKFDFEWKYPFIFMKKYRK
jgi:hypothetical protein